MQIKERNDGKQPAADAKDGEEHKTKRVCTRQESNEIVKNVEKHASEKESLNSTFDHEKDVLMDDMNNEYSMLDQGILVDVYGASSGASPYWCDPIFNALSNTCQLLHKSFIMRLLYSQFKAYIGV